MMATGIVDKALTSLKGAGVDVTLYQDVKAELVGSGPLIACGHDVL